MMHFAEEISAVEGFPSDFAELIFAFQENNRTCFCNWCGTKL